MYMFWFLLHFSCLIRSGICKIIFYLKIQSIIFTIYLCVFLFALMCFIHFPSALAISVPRYDQPPPLPPPITYQPRPPERNQPVLVPANPYHTAEIPDWLQVYARAPLKWVHMHQHTLRCLHTNELGLLVISEAPLRHKGFSAHVASRFYRQSAFPFFFSFFTLTQL